MNLIYLCVFFNKDYIKLLKLLLSSILSKGSLNLNNTNILILTDDTFIDDINVALEELNLNQKYFILSNINSVFKASASKVKIFDYEQINLYDKILYLDTDIIINDDINKIFNLDIKNDILYTKQEGWINSDWWGNFLFDFNDKEKNIDKDSPAFNGGLLFFKNSLIIKNLFNDINNHMIKDTNNFEINIPACLEQPYIVYHAFIGNIFDNQLLNDYITLVFNFHDFLKMDSIIYHFCGGPGNYITKYEKMNYFLLDNMSKDKHKSNKTNYLRNFHKNR